MGLLSASSHGNPVEAGGGQGLIGVPIEFRIAGQEVQRRARSGQRPGDGHGQHDIPLVVDPGVPGGVAVGAAGLELIAQRGFGHEDVHAHGNENRDKDAPVDLGAGEELVHPQLGGLHAVAVHIGPGPVHQGPAIGSLVDVAALRVFHRVLKYLGGIEEPGHQVGGNPVCHNTG